MKVPLEELLRVLKIADGSDGSKMVRDLLSKTTWPDHKEVVKEAMQLKGDQAAFALQDCVNAIGGELDFDVHPGRYRGMKDEVGHDGLWKSETKRDFVVEVKKSGAYAIDPHKLVSYIVKLTDEGQVDKNAVGLYVVGSPESSVLENTIKGAGFASRLRVITVDGLIRLTDLYNQTGLLHQQVVSLLSPIDSVRVDELLGIISEVLEKQGLTEEEESGPKAYSPTSSKVIQSVYSLVTRKLEASLHAQVSVPSEKLREWDGGRAILYYSKDYGGGRYWFAVNPRQVEFLEGASISFAIFACASADNCIVWPFGNLRESLQTFNVTKEETRMFWHVQVFSGADAKPNHWIAKGKAGTVIDLDAYHNGWDNPAKKV